MKGEEKRGLCRSDEQAEPCRSTSVSNGLALCIDIILATSYSLSFLLPAISLTSYSSPHIVPLPAAVAVSLRAVLTMSQTSPSYSPCPTRYRPRRVVLALIVATSYSLSSSIRKKLRNYPCTSVRTTCVGSFPSICSSGKDSESYRSNHPLMEASKAMDAPPILPTQPPTLPTQPPTLPTQPPPYGS